MTGETISLFLDKDAIHWGEDWRDKIDSNLASVAFFIPVMTPRYFMSPECRRELQFFARRATDLGIKDLILPLLYVDVPSLHDETVTDDLIALVRTFQWEDWRDLRFFDVTSEGYRRGVGRLATRLVEANRHAEATTTALPVDETPDESIDNVPGLIDQLATAEETLPEWQETVEVIKQDIELIGQVMREATDEIRRGDAQGKGFSNRRSVARRVALLLREPTEHIWSLGNKFASQLHDVDVGFRAIIERALTEIRGNPNSKSNICVFFEALRALSAASHDGLESVQRMVDATEPLERMSRDLRPVLRRLRQGLAIMVESREVSDEWVRLIDSSGVDCAGVDASASKLIP